MTYSIIVVLTGHGKGARHRIISRTGVDYSQFTLTMMVPGKNSRREPEGAPALMNLPILLLLRVLLLRSQGGINLTWRTNEQTNRAEWQDGTK